MSHRIGIDRAFLEQLLKELAKEYRRQVGKRIPAEIVLVGGGALLLGYGFRHSTYDIDALISAASALKDAARQVGNLHGLSADWLNTDFQTTVSYSPKLLEHSDYYKKFSNVLTVRYVKSEYLIAMKLMSGRVYKHDLSDIVGILKEEEAQGTPLDMDTIETAVHALYGVEAQIRPDIRERLEYYLSFPNKIELFQLVSEEEEVKRRRLQLFEQNYPGILKEGNLLQILDDLEKSSVDQLANDKGRPQ